MIRNARKYCFNKWLDPDDQGISEVFWRRAFYLFRYLDERLAKRG